MAEYLKTRNDNILKHGIPFSMKKVSQKMELQ